MRGPQRIYYYKRAAQFTPFTIPAPASDTVSLYRFGLFDLPNYAEFTTLYDQYQIAGVKISFVPLVNTVASNLGTVSGTGTVFNYMRTYSCIDYNNITAPASVNAMREYQTFKWKPITKVHSRYIRPKPQMLNGTDGYTPQGKMPWFDTNTAANSQLYGGVVFGVDAIPNIPTGTQLFSVEVKMYIKFRTVI